MALKPSLWGTLPEELLHLVFPRLPINEIIQLRVLSKQWKRNIDCKDSEFNRQCDETTPLERFAHMSWDDEDETYVSLDVQTNEWFVLGLGESFSAVVKTSRADGGLFCIPRQCRSNEGRLHLIVVNLLTQSSMKLPPLLRMGAEESDVEVKMTHLTMDRKTKEYELQVLCDMKTGGKGFFAQVYDFHKKKWSMMESREGRIIGWEHSDSFSILGLCVYNYADRKLQRFYPSELAPGLTVSQDCIELINDHLFVLHKEAAPSSTNLVQDGDNVSRKYCISEFHLPKKAAAWVKLGVHECDPSIYAPPQEDCELSLLACNGFLAVRIREYREVEVTCDRLWLYNMSTCVWRILPELDLVVHDSAMLCEINWNALP